MKVKRRKRRGPIVPTNAMSDISFLLLIFIMVVSLITYRKEVKIDYPEAEYQEVTNADKNMEIWIDKKGLLYFNGDETDLSNIEGLIADGVVLDPAIRIHIIADKNTPYKYIDGVLDILKLLQHRTVSFVVKDSSK